MASTTGFATPIPPEHAAREAEIRLRRLRGLAWLLDRSIPIGPWRVGLDPVLGLVPGAGDWISSVMSLYVLYEGARLGMPSHVLTRMAGNILVDTLVGAVPVLGDLFDFAWQANARNLALVEKHYRPEFRPRDMRKIWVALLFFALLILAIVSALAFALVQLIAALFND